MIEKKNFRYKTHYKIMAWMSTVIMVLFVCVMYVGVYLEHWVTFDIGLFGGIAGCIFAVYNVIRYDKTKKLEISYAGDREESYLPEDSDEDIEDYEDDSEYDDD